MANLKNKKIVSLVVLTVLLIGMFFIVKPNFTDNNTNNELADVPTYTIHGNFNINVNNPKAVVGDADYVFLGKVVERKKTIYKNEVPLETKDGGVKYSGEAYTLYDVSVIDNIKNKLKMDENISIKKLGGIRKDGSAYDIFESDSLPEEGKTYIFIAYTQDDGSLLVSGPNSNIEIQQKAKMLNSVTSSKIYTKYKNVVKNQIPTDRKKLKSKYDASKN